MTGPDDPGRRHAGDRPGEHLWALGRRGPFARRRDPDGDQQADANAQHGLRGGQHGERGRGRAEPRADRDERRPGAEQLAQAGPPRRRGEDQCGQSAGRARDRPELPGRGGRDAELARDVDQDRGQHEQRRLGCEQAREQHRAGIVE